MNWDALGAIGEIGGSIAVIVTLIYLAIQIRHATKQSEIDSLRHTWDALNQFCDLICESADVASIVNRGRESLSSLNKDELLMFEHIHLRLLNTIESWYLQVDQTSKPGAYRDGQIENMGSIIRGYIDHPGVRELWRGLRHFFVTIAELVDQSISVSNESPEN